MTKRIIAINAEYRLSIDAENTQIERLITVDPTKSPNYNAEKHAQKSGRNGAASASFTRVFRQHSKAS